MTVSEVREPLTPIQPRTPDSVHLTDEEEKMLLRLFEHGTITTRIISNRGGSRELYLGQGYQLSRQDVEIIEDLASYGLATRIVDNRFYPDGHVDVEYFKISDFGGLKAEVVRRRRLDEFKS